jgi:hypothetical protein
MAYIGSECTEFHASGWTCVIVYLARLANLGKSATETQAMIRQAFGEESTSHAQDVETHRG